MSEEQQKPKHIAANIPASLTASHRWLVWKYGDKPNKNGKLPKEPFDLETPHSIDKLKAARYSFDEVLQAKGFEGIGVMPSGSQIALDFDSCYENGTITKAWVREILDRLQTYVEVSPSGKGLRAWVRGDAPKAAVNPVTNPLGLHKKPVKKKFEIYPDSPLSNYVTVTGVAIAGVPRRN